MTKARGPWIVLSLLTVSVMINYVDRGNLSVAADRLAREFQLNPERTGLLLSAFFWSYAGVQFFAGPLMARFNVYWLYASGFFLWSLATMLTGLSSGFYMIFGLRLLLGAGESVSYPIYSAIIARGMPDHRHGLANAMIDAGSKCGPAVGVLLCGSLVAHVGWRIMFLTVGGGSLLWLIPWVVVARGSAHLDHAAPAKDAPRWTEILSKRACWGTILGLFSGNYAWYFLLTWLPWYLIRERHFSTERMAILGSLPFWAVASSSLASGWISDCLVRRGGSPARVRKSFIVLGLLFATIMMPAAVVKTEQAALSLLILACVSFGLFSSHIFLITQRLAGPAAAGAWSGIQNSLGNLAGVVAPLVTGWIVNKTGQFFYAFVVVSAILVIGSASYFFIVGPIEAIVWQREVPEPLQRVVVRKNP